MTCQNCGAQLNEGAAFCPNCGTPVSQTQTQPQQQYAQPQQQYTQPPQQYNQPQYNQPQYNQSQSGQFFEDMTAANLGQSVFGFGLAGFICSLIFSILGLIFSIIALNKAKHYQAYTGGFYNKAATGRGFAIAGLIISIISIVITLVATICGGCVACLGAAGGLDYYY